MSTEQKPEQPHVEQTPSASHGYAKFSDLCYGARFQYDERKHGEQHQVWVKIGHNTIAKWDRANIATRWSGQSICSFAEDDSGVDELVFIVYDA